MEDWKREAADLAAAHHLVASDSEENLKRTLVQLHQLFSTAPRPIFSTFEGLSELTLSRECERRSALLARGDCSWEAPAGSDEREWAMTIGAQIRAVDQSLMTSMDHLGPRGEVEWLVADLDTYVIPRAIRLKGRRPKQGQGFDKRGVIHHRLIPKHIDGYEVCMVYNDTRPVPGARDPVRFGACLFENLVLETRPTGEGEELSFVATGITCKDEAGTIDRQIAAAIAEQCSGVVWPELSITPEARERIKKALADRALSLEKRQAPEVVVAGSWHERDGDRYVNRACVYDGYGVRRVVYEKTIAYVDRELGPEDIRPGRKLPVLVTDGHLIGFAICKDFCDLAVAVPYLKLDVDLVVVPSMGNAQTMRGHQNTAQRLQVKHGTRTFVVQQTIPVGAKPANIGMVLPMLADPSTRPTSKLHQIDVWKAYKRPP